MRLEEVIHKDGSMLGILTIEILIIKILEIGEMILKKVLIITLQDLIKENLKNMTILIQLLLCLNQIKTLLINSLKGKILTNRMHNLKENGLIGCLNNSGITSQNYKDKMNESLAKQLHDLYGNFFNRIREVIYEEEFFIEQDINQLILKNQQKETNQNKT